jgi:hypothetical protein
MCRVWGGLCARPNLSCIVCMHAPMHRATDTPLAFGAFSAINRQLFDVCGLVLRTRRGSPTPPHATPYVTWHLLASPACPRNLRILV